MINTNEIDRAVRAEIERDELAAKLDRLSKAAAMLRRELAQWALTEQDPETSAAMYQYDLVANEEPDESLNIVKERLIQDMVKKATFETIDHTVEVENNMGFSPPSRYTDDVSQTVANWLLAVGDE